MKTPEEFLYKYGISSDTTIGIEGDVLLTDLLKAYAAQFQQPRLTNEQIDAMYPLDDTIDWQSYTHTKRQAARQVRDLLQGKGGEGV
jgi:hypothetical protein